MRNLFNAISGLIGKRPVKVLLITSLIFMVLIAGLSQINLATGNETLVKTDTKAYLSNLEMENNFGGDSIIVLFEGESFSDLIDQDTISKMWNVENALQYDEDIYSIISPASLVHQVSNKQFTEIKKKVEEISNGLGEMSTKMTQIGNELGSKEIKDPSEIQGMLNNLSQSVAAFDKLIQAQNEMGKGTEQLQTGLGQTANGLDQVANQLEQLGNNLGSTNQQLSTQLKTISTKLKTTSDGLVNMTSVTTKLNNGQKQTANALTNIKNKLGSQTSQFSSASGALSKDQLNEMANGFVSMGEKLGEISNGLGMFHEKSNMLKADIPQNQEEINNIVYDSNGQPRSIFTDVFKENKYGLMVVKLAGNIETENKDAIVSKLDQQLKDQGFHKVDYIVSGKPVLDSALRSEMTNSMKQMVVLAVALMFLILTVIFKVRWRILSLPIIFFAVLATLGLMGIVGIPMTMVSMAVFPILIGLGVDYAIQFQNRYEEERSLKTTIKQMGPAVGTAIFATMLGFIALYLSPVPMIIDFGKMLSIGVVISYIAGIFILMSILYLRDRFFHEIDKEKIISKKKEGKGLIEKGLKGLTSYVIKYSAIVLILAVTVTGWGIWADEKVGVETDIEKFMPQDTAELQQIHKLRDVLGSTDQIVVYLEDDQLLNKEHLQWIDGTSENLISKYPNQIIETKSITTLVRKANDGKMLDYDKTIEFINDLPEKQRKMFINNENDKSVILLNIKHMPVEDVKLLVQNIEKEMEQSSIKATVTGKGVLDVEMIDGLTSGRVEMTFLGMGLVFLGLLLVYRNPIRAFIPVFPISLIVGLSGGIMNILGLKYTPLTATLGALIIGIGTEFTILLLERYLEERQNGKEKLDAMQTAVSKIGKAIIASGMTVIGGFSALIISNFVILQDFGMMTVINMSLALFSTLVVLPPVIYLLDRFIVRGEKAKKSVPVLDR